MEYNKPVSNPMLVGAIELLRVEDTPEHRQLLSDEIVKGEYLCPAVVTPVPTPDENGEFHLGPQHKVTLPALTSPEGKGFFMAFTDAQELKKWKKDEEVQTVTMTFKDYAAMLYRKDANGNINPVAGFVINPYSTNIIVPKELAARYLASELAKEDAAKAASEDVYKV